MQYFAQWALLTAFQCSMETLENDSFPGKTVSGCAASLGSTNMHKAFQFLLAMVVEKEYVLRIFVTTLPISWSSRPLSYQTAPIQTGSASAMLSLLPLNYTPSIDWFTQQPPRRPRHTQSSYLTVYLTISLFSLFVPLYQRCFLTLP